MIFAVVEAMIFGGLLEYRACYPRDRRWTTLALIIHSAAIICSLTRGLWIACLVLLAIHLHLAAIESSVAPARGPRRRSAANICGLFASACNSPSRLTIPPTWNVSRWRVSAGR